MKKLFIALFGIMVLITLGCTATKTAPLTQTPAPVTNETALKWFERGSAYVQAGNFEDAVKDFTHAITSDPGFVDAYYSRGRVLGRLGKHEQAIDDFSQVILLNPKNASAYADRGAAYGSLGWHEMAIADFTQAIALNPNFAMAHYNRAIGYFVEKKCLEAQKDMRQAQELGYHKIQPEFLDALNKVCPEK